MRSRERAEIEEAETRIEADASERGLIYEPGRATLRPFFRGRSRERRRAERLGVDLDGAGGYRDHGRIFLAGRTPAVFIGEPYVLRAADLADIDLLAGELPLRVNVSAGGLWCRDPQTIRVELEWLT